MNCGISRMPTITLVIRAASVSKQDSKSTDTADLKDNNTPDAIPHRLKRFYKTYAQKPVETGKQQPKTGYPC